MKLGIFLTAVELHFNSLFSTRHASRSILKNFLVPDNCRNENQKFFCLSTIEIIDFEFFFAC